LPFKIAHEASPGSSDRTSPTANVISRQPTAVAVMSAVSEPAAARSACGPGPPTVHDVRAMPSGPVLAVVGLTVPPPSTTENVTTCPAVGLL
jgi:hypothetical protein